MVLLLCCDRLSDAAAKVLGEIQLWVSWLSLTDFIIRDTFAVWTWLFVCCGTGLVSVGILSLQSSCSSPGRLSGPGALECGRETGLLLQFYVLYLSRQIS